MEIAGITGDLDAGTFVVVECADEVARYNAVRIAVMAQTTSVEPEVRAIVEKVRAMNPGSEVRFVNTICRPTRDRQAALERLIEKVKVLVVVGGHHSNNTRQLAARGREAGLRVIQVETATELGLEMFKEGELVGLTAWHQHARRNNRSRAEPSAGHRRGATPETAIGRPSLRVIRSSSQPGAR